MVSNYWKKRYEAEMKHRQKSENEVNKELLKLYQRHFNEISKEIELMISRYAIDENIPPSEMRKRVKDLDVQLFKDKAKMYVKERDFSDRANEELNTYNLKMRINRLSLLQYNIDLEILSLINAEEKLAERVLNKAYEEELKFQSGILGEYVEKPVVEAHSVVNNTFHGALWSSRIWDRQNQLRKIVAKSVEDLLLKGRNPTTLIGKIKKEFEVSKYQARRLLVTEGARVQTETQKLMYEDNGFSKYEYIAEPSACPICSELDGKVFELEEMEIGKNACPMHPHCHCATVPVYSEENDDKSIGELKEIGYNKGNLESKNIGKKINITDIAISKVPLVKIPEFTDVDNINLKNHHKELLKIAKNENNSNEVGGVYSISNFNGVKWTKGSQKELSFSKESNLMISGYPEKDLVVIHNHPGQSDFSMIDLGFFFNNQSVKTLTIVTNYGKVKYISKNKNYNKEESFKILSEFKIEIEHAYIKKDLKLIDYTLGKYFKKAILKDNGLDIKL